MRFLCEPLSARLRWKKPSWHSARSMIFPIYLITINNSIAIDLRESMMLARDKWLTGSDGILLCVDTSTYRLVTEEVTSSFHDEDGS